MDRSTEQNESDPAVGIRPNGHERTGHPVDTRPRRRRPRPTPDSPRHREDNDEAWVRALTGPPICATPPGT